jgi:hypothetical protein
MLPSEKNKYIGKLKPIAQLEFAIQKADLELVRSIFKNPNLSIEIDLSQSSGPLSLACTYGHLDIVQYLMSLLLLILLVSILRFECKCLILNILSTSSFGCWRK